MLNQIQESKARKSALHAGWGEFHHLILAGLFGCVAIGLVALAAWILDEPAAVFTREPQAILNGSFYVGSFSNLGGLVWFGAASILSFAWSLKPSERGALILAALVTWAMGVDDVFMLHDRVYPKLHLSEILISALYFGGIGLIGLLYYRRLARSTLLGMALAVIFWVSSTVLDQFFNHAGQLAEDGTKFIGIVVWAAAWVRQAYSDTRSASSS